MDKITANMRKIAKAALANGEVDKIIGWKKGEFWQDTYPVFITKENEAEDLVWDCFSVNNLSKYLIEQLKGNKKIGIFLKGCDSLGFNQLLKDHRIDRERVIIYGISCYGMIDPEKVRQEGLHHGLKEIKRSGDDLIFIRENGEKRITGRQFDYDKCLNCRYPNPVIYDKKLTDEVQREINYQKRFDDVKEIEEMSYDERYDYWANQFSKCIRCYACRNVCPACSCEKCIFDNTKAGILGKAKVASEEQFYHIIRAYHVAGRCVDCGECSRVCPAGIPLDKLNHKIIKDINELYGEYEAGINSDQDPPLLMYQLDDKDSFTGHGGGRK
ncbi:4Fe-4S dicluster domain-containing protein [Garciella nitratireducens]|uniref:4Fe-4S dicluster domain-containing protein n=1 Tax=Garciella nitratireducens TaxID=218205 RepID=UPI001BD5BAFF|nr:4Fe-4S dicluster domain-containing protein [Garciella nitratireducens]